jgi:hypothetical protein
VGTGGKAECGASAEGWRERFALRCFFAEHMRRGRISLLTDAAVPSPPAPSGVRQAPCVFAGLCFFDGVHASDIWLAPSISAGANRLGKAVLGMDSEPLELPVPALKISNRRLARTGEVASCRRRNIASLPTNACTGQRLRTAIGRNESSYRWRKLGLTDGREQRGGQVSNKSEASRPSA